MIESIAGGVFVLVLQQIFAVILLLILTLLICALLLNVGSAGYQYQQRKK